MASSCRESRHRATVPFGAPSVAQAPVAHALSCQIAQRVRAQFYRTRSYGHVTYSCDDVTKAHVVLHWYSAAVITEQRVWVNAYVTSAYQYVTSSRARSLMASQDKRGLHRSLVTLVESGILKSRSYLRAQKKERKSSWRVVHRDMHRDISATVYHLEVRV